MQNAAVQSEEKPTSFFEFLIQLALSTVGAMILGIAAIIVPALLIAASIRTPGASLTDVMTALPLFRWGADNPYFVGPILAGFVLGVVSLRFFRSQSAAFVWVVPTLILIAAVLTASPSGGSRLSSVWNDFFGSDCEASECLLELLITAPFYTSLAYSLGWSAGKSFRLRRGAQ